MIPEWLSWVNAWVALPLALVGFYLTFRQASKARSSAEAAKDASNEATERFRTVSTLVTINQLTHIEQYLDIAVERRSPELLRYVVHNWNWQAGAYRTFLEGNESADVTDTQRAIQSSLSAIQILKPRIHRFDDDTDWVTETERLRKAIGKIAKYLGAISASQALDEGTSNG